MRPSGNQDDRLGIDDLKGEGFGKEQFHSVGAEHIEGTGIMERYLEFAGLVVNARRGVEKKNADFFG